MSVAERNHPGFRYECYNFAERKVVAAAFSGVKPYAVRTAEFHDSFLPFIIPGFSRRFVRCHPKTDSA